MEDVNSGNEDTSGSSSATSQSGVSTESTPMIEGSVPPFPPPSYKDDSTQSQILLQDEVPQNSESHDGKKAKAQQIYHKSTKELYRAIAAQWGITCKMSDHCRCIDCQSRYFDCDYDMDEQEKTDGGLSASTPMFLTEVMHGSACNIL